MEAPQIPIIDPSFRLELPAFSGPLDLLLHLIQKHELDLLELPVAFVSERYLEHLRLMEILDLDIASEYLVMAAKLVHLKSRLLLPQRQVESDETTDDDEEIDPRAELIRRLLDYQKYRQAARELDGRPQPGRDTFARVAVEAAAASDAPSMLAPSSLNALVQAFATVMRRIGDRRSLVVAAEQLTVQERMAELTLVLAQRRAMPFEDLFAADRSRQAVVVSFLAVLELVKSGLISLSQERAAAPLMLYANVELHQQESPEDDSTRHQRP